MAGARDSLMPFLWHLKKKKKKKKRREAKIIADLYGFVHISSTQGLQEDSKRSPGGIQVVLHHLITKSKHVKVQIPT